MIKKVIQLLVLLIVLSFYSSIDFAEHELQNDQVRRLGELVGYYDGMICNEKPIVEKIVSKYEYYFGYRDENNINYFIEGYYVGFEKGFEDKQQYNFDVDGNKDYGKTLGYLLGQIYGISDYINGEEYNANNCMPSDKAIINNYDLDKLSVHEKYAFINSFKKSFHEGYSEGYYNSNSKSSNTNYENGIRDGENFGSILGKRDGLVDYSKNVPKDEDIIQQFMLDLSDHKYKEGFLTAFKKAYELAYSESFNNMHVDENMENYKYGYKTGFDVGLGDGEIYANEDYYSKKINNWRSHYPDYMDLIFDYNLLLEDENYRIGFLSGYLQGFFQGYRDTYYKLHYNSIVNIAKIETIPISGGEIKSNDDSFLMKIEEGTYYNPVLVTLKTLSDYYASNFKLSKVSDIYNINILNKSGKINDNKMIEIMFEYYGKYNGGIYKLVNDRWIYIPSSIEDGYIKTKIKPSSLTKSNTFCVFVDEDYKLLYDVRNHWGKDEIIAFHRNGIVSGYPNGTFKPDKEITLGEFFSILTKIDNSNQQIVREYSDKYNDKNQKVRYKDVETIMRKVLNTDSFNWKEISLNILYDKHYKSKSFDSMDNFVTRAEVIYMFYLLEEWE